MSQFASYISSLDLPEAPLLRNEAQLAAATFTEKAQALSVGAQVTEFSAKVPASMRPAVGNSLLVAQLAAEKATGGQAAAREWFTSYNNVLGRIGWQLNVGEIAEQQLAQSNLALHKAIIPVLTAAFAGAAGAGALIVSVLQGLQNMDQDAPWITLFDRKSQTASGARFGLSYVDAGPGGGVGLTSVYFGVTAAQTITQVLFFKFSDAKARLESAKTEAMLSASTIEDTDAALRQKAAPFLVDNIKNIDI